MLFEKRTLEKRIQEKTCRIVEAERYGGGLRTTVDGPGKAN